MLTCSRVFLAAAIMSGWMNAAAASEAAELHFPIRGFEVSGSTLISQEAALASVQAFIGAERSFADVEKARLTLQALYEKAGYGAVQVMLPEQEITSGMIRFKVVEARIKRVDYAPTPYHDRDNILYALPELREGRAPNTLDLARSLALANESAVKQTVVTLNSGEQLGEINAKVSVRDDKPWRGYLSAENNGSESSGGDWRLSAGFSHGNVFNRDQLVAVQAITSVEHPEDVQILGGYWKLPLPALGDSVELSASYANVSGNITAAGGSLAYQAAGYSAGTRYVHNLAAIGDYKHNLSAGLDYRLIETEQNITPDYSLTPLSLAYSGNKLGKDAHTYLALSYARNLGLAEKGDSALIAANGGRDKDYQVVRLSLSHDLFFGKGWDALFAASGQWTDEPLPGAEDFGIGGAASVRGFEEREFFGDKGVRAGVEVTTPSLLDLPGTVLRLAGFADYGQVWDVATNIDTAIASAGLGLRLTLSDSVLISVDASYILDGGGVHNEDPGRIHARLVWGF